MLSLEVGLADLELPFSTLESPPYDFRFEPDDPFDVPFVVPLDVESMVRLGAES